MAKRAKKAALQLRDAGVNAMVAGAKAARRKIAAVVHTGAVGTATVLNIAAGAGRRRKST